MNKTATLSLVLFLLSGGCTSEVVQRKSNDGSIPLPDGAVSPLDGADLPSSLVDGAAVDGAPPTSDLVLTPDVGKPNPDSKPAGGGFGYPVGDRTTSPAGGWTLWQNLSHYWASWGGRHLGHDVSLPGGQAAIDAPVYAVAAGKVLYAKTNTSTYKHVVLLEHTLPAGGRVCSFYGHITKPVVAVGATVTRGQKIASVIDWAQAQSGGSSNNTHLHYVLLSDGLCKKAEASGGTSGGSGVCGYDKGGPSSLGATDLKNEPFSYTAIGDACGNHNSPKGFISPAQFIDANHF